jgi:hypothetical protein
MAIRHELSDSQGSTVDRAIARAYYTHAVGLVLNDLLEVKRPLNLYRSLEVDDILLVYRWDAFDLVLARIS